MRTIIFIASFLITTYCYSQNFSEVAISVLSKEQLISKVISNPKFVKNKTLTSWFNMDSIDFDVVIYSDTFNDRVKTAKGLEQVFYQIVVYTIHDSMFLKNVYSLEYKRDTFGYKTERTPIFSYTDTTRILEFIQKHNEKYYSSWTLQDFFGDRSTGYGFFGFLCGGIVPHITNEAYSLARLVKAKDSLSLKLLASSFSAQDRAYGSAGLFFMVLRGQLFSEELLDLIGINQESRIVIQYCDGCLAGTQRLSDALDITNLKYLYKLLVRYQLL